VCVCVCAQQHDVISRLYRPIVDYYKVIVYTASQKNISDISDCNFRKDYQILIIFDTNILDTAGRQTIL